MPRTVTVVLAALVVTSDPCTLSAQGWLPASVATLRPGARWNASLCADASGGALVFGGRDAAGPSHETWAYDPAADSWLPLQVPSQPAARSEAAMAFDWSRNRVVLFGGDSGQQVLGDTWEFDGVVWTQAQPTTAPAARAGHGIAHDMLSGHLLLFGGRLANGLGDASTWLWNGSQWQELVTSHVPTLGLRPASPGAPLHRFGLVYDPSRQACVLHGGLRGAALSNQTWIHHGGDWHLLTTGPALFGHCMAFCTSLGEVVLHGGDDARLVTSAATWRLRQDRWERLQAEVAPSPLSGAGMAGTITGQVVMFGGTSRGVPTDGLWVFEGNTGPQRLAHVSIFGEGCGAHLVVEPGDAPLPGRLVRLAATANGPVDLASWGIAFHEPAMPASLSAIGLPACSDHLGMLSGSATVQVTGFGSLASQLALSIPNQAGLVGLEFVVQGVLLRLAAAEVAATDAARLVVGN